MNAGGPPEPTKKKRKQIPVHFAIGTLAIFGGANFGMFMGDRDLMNLVAAVFCVGVAIAIIRGERQIQRLDRQILFMKDDIAHLFEKHPHVKRAWNYAHKHYRPDHADLILTLPRIHKLVGEAEFKGRELPEARLYKEIDTVAAAAEIPRLEEL